MPRLRAMNIKKIEKLIANRDGISRNEARAIIDECREEIELAISMGHFDKVEEILADYLGLEPDYLQDIINI